MRRPRTASPDPGNRPWLLWDGSCGVCCWWVAWARRRGAGRHYRIVPYQEAPEPPMNEELRARARRAVQVITEDGTNLEAGRACLHVLGAVGMRTPARLLQAPPLLWLFELGYRTVARNRGFFSRFMSRDPETCRR